MLCTLVCQGDRFWQELTGITKTWGALPASNISASKFHSSSKLSSHQIVLLLQSLFPRRPGIASSNYTASTAIPTCLLHHHHYLPRAVLFIVPVLRHYCMFGQGLLPSPSSHLVRQPVASRTTACILPHHGYSTQEGFGCTPKTG